MSLHSKYNKKKLETFIWQLKIIALNNTTALLQDVQSAFTMTR